MSLLFFFVPLHRTEPAASELNAALAADRVLKPERTSTGQRLSRLHPGCSVTQEVADVAG
ncbi:hypothetical protein KAK06_22860 [Ideonella sp. 4Y11]|uniref:Uncharacterized protein n=1 Tax=Ideonella aquatica TaxID=2824119 RepID=A0A941BIB7_9BURK|nr:hypothetical protein [Ideonella aquatica]MBQ0961796.1 hypothetical protein [Ideonella aquatica]